MECPHCKAELPDDDFFCEACGKPLGEESPVPRCTCGASIEEADEEGFCSQCGRRVRPRETDHIELEISDHFAAVSDKGKRHDRNEDRFSVHQFETRAGLVVCDGVSTSGESELASSLAAQKIVEALGTGLGLGEAFRQAGAAVAELTARPGDSAPSTTAVAALVEGRAIEVAWTGDSRAYWIDDSHALPLTSDHSWLADIVHAGLMTAEDAARDSRAHAITRWLGADAHDDGICDTARFEVPGQGWLLLCSDGLWNYASEPEEMQQHFAKTEGSALERARSLVTFANEQGGQDNITVALLRFDADDIRE